MKNLIEIFKKNADKAQREADEAVKERDWTKCERKEAESQTWLEASRMLKKGLGTVPPTADKQNICPDCNRAVCGDRCQPD